jgi:TolB-like protein
VTEPSHAVFLSYASQDAEAAQKICEALRAAGVEVWFDQSELRGGEAWDRDITEQIRESALFLAVISAHTEERSEGYFRREWRVALERMRDMADDRTFLIPVVIDTTPEDSARVPDRFREFQWIRLPAGETSPAAIERIQRLLAPARPTHRAVRADSQAGAARDGLAKQPSWLGPAVLVLLVVVIAGGSYIAWEHFVLSKGPTSASTTIADKSIAVLPFADLSERHDQEYFADGMAEEIIDLLAKVPELKVIGRISSFQFKGKTGDWRNIGEALGAAYIVDGSVRKSGKHVRVTAQLIDTRDGTHRWSETYDRTMEDVLRVQDEIALGLVRALQVEVASSVFAQSPTTPQAAEANDSYLRGLHARDRFDRQGLSEAAADFRQALVIDATFAPAAEALALTLKDMATWAFVPPRTGYPQAQAAVEAALRLNPKSALAHAVACVIDLQYEWEWAAGARECEMAERLGPRQPYVPIAMAIARMPVGKWSEATYFIEAAGALNPLDPRVHEVAGLLYINAGRFAEAEAALRRSLEISPTYVRDHLYLGTALVLEGRPQEALTEMQQEAAPGGRDAGLVVAYHALHRDEEALAALTRLKAEHANDAAMLIAQACAFISDNDQAFAWLERAYAQKDSKLYYLKGDPLLKGLESDPRYSALLRKMNLPE